MNEMRKNKKLCKCVSNQALVWQPNEKNVVCTHINKFYDGSAT